MSSSEKTECAREACSCMVTAPIDPALGSGGEAYCSDGCASDAIGTFDAACTCGHPPCDAAG